MWYNCLRPYYATLGFLNNVLFSFTIINTNYHYLAINLTTNWPLTWYLVSSLLIPDSTDCLFSAVQLFKGIACWPFIECRLDHLAPRTFVIAHHSLCAQGRSYYFDNCILLAQAVFYMHEQISTFDQQHLYICCGGLCDLLKGLWCCLYNPNLWNY